MYVAIIGLTLIELIGVITSLAIWAFIVWFCTNLAEKKQRSRQLGVLVGALFGIFAIPIMLCIPRKRQKESSQTTPKP
ncbi:MAG TPA: hypothetical protein VI759_10425 [Dehalococcoidia bacterium]|nr:hypothetical protein [Dehalococcoidia bacterium]